MTSRIQWQGRSWRLRVEEVRLPDGSTLERGHIEHPGSVVLVPLLDESVLLLYQYRRALQQAIWELPAGTRGWDEDWLVCAQRELQEETGYRAGRLVELGRIWPAPGVSDERMALYLATDLAPAPLPPDADEEIELRPLPLAEALAMAQDGRLQDAKSIVALLWAARALTP